MEEKRKYTKFSEEKQSQITELSFLKIKTKVELAKEYGITTNTIGTWEKNTLEALKKLMS